MYNRRMKMVPSNALYFLVSGAAAGPAHVVYDTMMPR